MNRANAEMQIEILRRIIDRLHLYGLALKDNHTLDFADHLKTEMGYLVEALDISKEK